MRFGEKLRQMRLDRQWTQPELAEKLGIEQSWLSKIENDKSMPSSELLAAVEEVFNIELAALLAQLDRHYVRNTLAALPEVKSLLLEQRQSRGNKTKTWLLTAATLVVLGVTLSMSAYLKLLFTDVVYRYEAWSHHYPTEPQIIVIDPEETIARLVQVDLVDTPEEERVALYDYQRDRLQLNLEGRSSRATALSALYRGSFYVEEITLSESGLDIYGAEVAAGSHAYRVFVYDGEFVLSGWGNRLLMLLGIFLCSSGLAGFVLQRPLRHALEERGG